MMSLAGDLEQNQSHDGTHVARKRRNTTGIPRKV